MPLIRLFSEKPNAIRLDEIPPLTRQEMRQRENTTQYDQPDASYIADWAQAQEDAKIQWRAMRLELGS